MNQSKTAMQILIDKMKEELLHLNERSAESILLMATIRLANSLLADEKLQIRRAFTDGEQNVWDRHKEEEFQFQSGIDYYKKTFENESETIS